MKYWITGILFFICVGMTRRICDHNVTDYTPITDLVNLTFSGYTGGLYPDGNDIPAAHFANGMTHATQIIPRNETGQADAGGALLQVVAARLGLLCVRACLDRLRLGGVGVPASGERPESTSPEASSWSTYSGFTSKRWRWRSEISS